MPNNPINSEAYWNERFATDWSEAGGHEQTAFFADIALSLFPAWFSTYLKEGEKTLLDWGCALGDSAPVFADAFPHLQYSGLDVAKEAIDQAKQTLPAYSFSTPESLGDQTFDVVFSSNTLEHFSDPFAFFPELTQKSKGYLAILVPFEEYDRIEEHLVTFTLDNLHPIMEDLTLVSCRWMDTSKLDTTKWVGKQILLIYAKKSSKVTAHENAPLSDTFYSDYQYEPSTVKNIELNLKHLQSQLSSMESLLEQNMQNHRQHIERLEAEEQKRAQELQRTQEALLRTEKNLKEREAEIRMIHQSLTWKLLRVYQAITSIPRKVFYGIHRGMATIAKKVLPMRVQHFILINLAWFNPRFYITRHKNKKRLLEILAEHPDRKGILIYPPTIDWGFLFQRPQQLTRAFAEAGYLCFYCTGNFSVDSVQGFEKKEERVYVTNDYEVLVHAPDPTVLISWSINKAYLRKYRYKQFIYDYIDELDIFHMYDEKMVKEHKELVQRADVPVATADKLFQQIAPLNDRAILAPNGVMLADFVWDHPPQMPLDMQVAVQNAQHVIGYYGALAEWFDYDLVREVAKMRPDYAFVLIGPKYDKSSDAYDWSDYKNIHFLGSKSYQELRKYSYHFDVATIPFKINKITESTSPVKLFEYMAQKLPIVTTPMVECKKYASVHLGETAKEFAEQLDAAIAKKNDLEYQKLLMKEAQENTWQARVAQMIEALDRAQKPS